MYSSRSLVCSMICSSSQPSAVNSVRICAWRSSKASETYLRKTNPRTTSLYCEASIEPRSLSAAFHSVSLSSFMVDGIASVLFFGGNSVPFPYLRMQRPRGDAECYHVGQLVEL